MIKVYAGGSRQPEMVQSTGVKMKCRFPEEKNRLYFDSLVYLDTGGLYFRLLAPGALLNK